MFFVLQNIHIKKSPNRIKTDEDFFGNIYEFWEEEPTRDDARVGHEPTRVGVARRNRERQRDRSNLGGALAPPTPWRLWTRGETLLPSKEKVKEEEEGGGLSPPRFRWHRSATGAIIV